MLKHIILWKLDEKLTESEKETVKQNAKRELEGLYGKIDGLNKIEITIYGLPSSNADMMLYSELEDEDALDNYRVSPVHNAVADKFVRPYTVQRLCLDFEA